MPNIKLNTKILLAVAFLAAAIDNTTVTVALALTIIFLCGDTEKAGLAVKAIVLSMVQSLVYSVIYVLSSLTSLVGISGISSAVTSIISIANGLVGFAVVIIGIMAAMNVLNDKEVSVPLVDMIHKDFDKICD